MKIVSSRMSFSNSYHSTMNHIFPDVMQTIKAVKISIGASGGSGVSVTNTLKANADSTKQNVLVVNVNMCTKNIPFDRK